MKLFTLRPRMGMAVRIGAVGALLASVALAQPVATSPLSPPTNGPRHADPTWHAFINATVHVSPTQTLEHATVVIRDGKIVSVTAAPAPKGDGGAAASPAAPAGARVWDCNGLHIYPGFIDAYVDVDAPHPDKNEAGVHWSPHVMPQRRALDGTGVDEKTAETMRKMGFTAAAIAPKDGVFRGKSAVVSLAKPASEASADRPPVYAEDVYSVVAFETSRGGRGRGAPGEAQPERQGPDVATWSGYPDSQMGAIALIRQTLSDADWQVQARANSAIAPNAIDALAVDRRRDLNHGPSAPPLLFDTTDELEVLRAIKIGNEFTRPMTILGSGLEFRRLAAISEGERRPSYIIPLAFPRAPKVTSIGDAESVELRDMMTWEQAPTNPRRLDAAGIDVSLTTSKLRDRSAFRDNLLKAIKHGLTPEKAFAMVTTHPAALLKVDSRLGTVEAGKVASLVIADGNLFDPKAGRDDKADAAKGEEGKEDAKGDDAKADQPGGPAGGPAGRGGRRGGGGAKVRDVWVDGVRHEINPAPLKDAIGAWVVLDTDGTVRDPAAADSVKFYVSESAVVYQRNGKEQRASNVRIQGVRVDYTIDAKSLFDIDSTLIDHAVVEGDMMYGVTPMPSGKTHRWSAKRTSTDSTPPRIASAGQGLPGRWIVTKVGDQPREKADAPVFNFRNDAVSVRVNGQDVQGANVAIAGDRADFTIDGAALGFDGIIAVKATLSGTKLAGVATTPDKQEHTFSADRQEGRRGPGGPGGGAVADGGGPGRGGDGAARKDPEQEEKDAIAAIPEKYGYPFGPYMMMEIPEQKDVLINHATIWTSGPDGIIQDGFIFIHEGKIAGIGTFGKLEIPKGDFITIDGKGKFISPGIIDCHSHTGISKGVNEGGQAVTAEVRIQDVTDPDSISWYRQLGGGVTTVNSLHGSANAIGGQNCVNKNRWGAIRPDDLHFEGAIPGIKFALGENPKWSNNGDRGTNRYPQTRMGVETLIRDRFTAAKQYLKAKKESKADSPRRDLELEALGEIIEGKRLVHCHSYRQDEILMLCRIADEFKFKIGTFQHVLEGYKVADEIAKHAIGGSCFSDWWAYKVEVQDAIPQDGPIMAEQGVVVSFNSDSDELARRLNWEAAKAIKYGKNMKPEDALKFVTLNPAKQLMIDKQVGSLEVGKDADFAIWSGPPMSAFSRCEATYIDGRKYFSLEDDAKMRLAIAKERGRLIQKLLAEPARGGDSGGGGPSMGGGVGRRRPVEGGMLSSYYLDLMNRGYDPSMARPGDCGCGEMHE